ncbi:cytochrome P450 [Goodfellowiella coeruleoviolacea]|uniref:Nocardicin N-oxygenase n=1 Tax=Goodfellowiella coeruleoviolacea TaxID=334858 RepID=A0AAE3KNM7_9PSEU|nr:cytochrome P450 [Goodfellowiella coeruleoviolacea]MCP2168833.1 nocardicin N-oxygenase [Goodfellowiella coeruleoviolacea]
MSRDEINDPLLYPFADGQQLRLSPRYAELRQTPGLPRVRLPHGAPAWLVTRYEDARFVLTDRRFRARVPGQTPDTPRMTPDPPPPEGDIVQHTGAAHMRLRKVLAKAFTVRRVEALRSRTTGIVVELIDDMEQLGPPADLVAHFALPLPMSVLSELIGIPPEHHDQVMTWSGALLGRELTTVPPHQTAEHVAAFTDYLTNQIRHRRATASGGVISELALACTRGTLNAREAAVLALSLVRSGREATTVALTNFVHLLSSTRQWKRLVDDPALVSTAVEELLRFTPLSAGALIPRCAVADAEVGGHLVRAGEFVIVPFTAANWDETAFTDPGDLDLSRRRNSHIAFGFGPHRCIAAELSRMVLQVALTQLVERMPELCVAVRTDELPWLTTGQFRGFARLPVSW